MTELRVFSVGAAEGIPTYVYIGLIATFCIGVILLLWLKGWRKGLRYYMLLLLAEWIFLVLGTCVIFRESGDECRISLIPLISYFDYGENSYFMEKAALNILNVELFIPVGLLFGLSQGTRNHGDTEPRNYGRGWKSVILIGSGISFTIEILQFIFKRGLCEIDDVIHNLLGCMIGFAIYRLSLRLINNV